MCVIVTAEKGSMPTIDQLTRMSETNPDGAGIAWHDGNGLHRVRHSDNGKTLAFITEHWNELKATPCLPQAGTEDGEGRNVRRSPACNRRRDTARRTFRPSPSEEQAND